MATAAQISLWLATKDAPKHLDRVLAQQTPQVRDTVKGAILHYELAADGGGRLKPFDGRISTQDVCDFHGFADPKVAERVYQELVDTALTSGLQQRMGTDDQLPVPDTTLRDQVEAAFNIHQLED